MDITSLSLSDLRRLEARIAAEIQKRSDIDRRNLLRQFRKMAAEKGLSFSELISPDSDTTDATAAPRRGRKPGLGQMQKKPPLPPKYFNPQDPSIGWSGRGRRPQWVLDWIAQDKPLEDLEQQQR